MIIPSVVSNFISNISEVSGLKFLLTIQSESRKDTGNVIVIVMFDEIIFFSYFPLKTSMSL